MSFWNKNKLPAEYKDLTEDQITELLAKGKNSESEAATAKARAEAAEAEKVKVAADLAEANKKLAGVSEWVENAKKNGVSPEGTRTENTPQGPPDSTDWITNPGDSFNRSVAPVSAIALHAGIMSARLMADQFIQRQGPIEKRLWNKYGDEVAKIVDGLPPEQRILPQTWINQFTFIKGMHVNEIVKDGQAAGDAFFSETAGPTGRGLPEDPNRNSDTLTDKELKIAKSYGIKPEDYLKRKKAAEYGPA
jgi:hypothetical protein